MTDELREIIRLVRTERPDYEALATKLRFDFEAKALALKLDFDAQRRADRKLFESWIEDLKSKIVLLTEQHAKIAEDPYSDLVNAEGTMEPTEVGMLIAHAIRNVTKVTENLLDTSNTQ